MKKTIEREEDSIIVAAESLAPSQVFADDHIDKQTNKNTNKDAKTQINPSF